jgi:hypothetical protein
VVLAPPGTTAAGEVRGGGPGTRESDLLGPAAGAREVQAVCFSGGSAFGLAAADGVVRWLEAAGRGYRTRLGLLVPLVPAAVVFDLPLGDPTVRPGPVDGVGLRGATEDPAPRARSGAGTGCASASSSAADGWTKGGVGLATEDVAGCRVSALAVVNAFGDVLAEDGTVLAARGATAASSARRLCAAGGCPTYGAREAPRSWRHDRRASQDRAWLLARRPAPAWPARSTGATASTATRATSWPPATSPSTRLVLAAVVPDVVTPRSATACAAHLALRLPVGAERATALIRMMQLMTHRTAKKTSSGSGALDSEPPPKGPLPVPTRRRPTGRRPCRVHEHQEDDGDRQRDLHDGEDVLEHRRSV